LDDKRRTDHFATAAALSRALDGTTNGRLFYRERESQQYVTVRPADANRRWLIRRLLDRQAERTIEDHWFDDALDPRPYFRLAATAYLDEQLPLSPDLRSVERHSARGHRLLRFLDERDELTVRFPASGPVVGTAEEPAVVRPLVRYRPPDPLHRNWEPARDPGSLAYWLEVPGDPASGGGPVVSRRQLNPLPDPPSEPTPVAEFLRLWGLGFGLPAPAEATTLPPVTLQTSEIGPAANPSQVILRARFRGRILERSHDLALWPVPDVVVDETPPPPGRVAVRAAPGVRARFGDSPGAVAVVLDCSGSMGARAGESRSKYDVAVDAVLEVLGRLPEGTGLSVWVFGADVPGERLTTPEDTVRRVRPLAPWRKQDHLPEIEATLRPLRPMYESPITFAALRAREELAAGPAGFTSLILLTDGLDNRWERDTRNNPTGRPVAESLRAAFDRSNVRLDVIAFSVPKEEADGVQAQFRVAEQLTPPGRFVNVAEVTKLVIPLREAVLANRQVGCVLRSASDPELEYRLTAGGPGGGDGWSPPLLSGAYQLWAGTPPLRMPDLTVRPGDNLVLRLAAQNGQLRIGREIVTDGDYGNYPPGLRKARTKDWQLAVAENRVEAGSLRLVPLLERVGSPALLEVVRPGRVWFEVSGVPAQPSGRVPAVRWRPDFNYPAAAWQVEAAGWLTSGAIAPPRPRLSVWWDDGTGVPPVTATVGATTRAAAGEVTVTGAEVRPDARGGTVLRVGVTCPPGRAFWVRPTEPGWVPVSHRFYRSVGRVVATFRTDRPVPGDVPQGFELVSVEQFKAAAARAGNALDLPGLDEPATRLPAGPRKAAGAKE
jgi:hypothetical protein